MGSYMQFAQGDDKAAQRAFNASENLTTKALLYVLRVPPPPHQLRIHDTVGTRDTLLGQRLQWIRNDGVGKRCEAEWRGWYAPPPIQ